MEWKRKPNLIWHTNAGLGRYWTLLEAKVNIKHCKEFVESMRTRSETEAYPSGVVEGVLVQFSSRYLHKFFGWDGLGATAWTTGCVYPKPDLATRVGDLQPQTEGKKNGRYDIFTLGDQLKDPWFSRMRGVLSQVYFQNNCNSITPEQLTLLLMADAGEKINWGMIVEENFRLQLRGYRANSKYSSPIGPFLSSYIAHYLAYHQRYGKGPQMGSFVDVQREIAQATTRDPALPGPSKRPRSSEPAKDDTQATTWGPQASKFHAQGLVLSNCVGEMLQWIHAAEQETATIRTEQRDLEERYKRKVTLAVQGAREQAQRILEKTHADYKQQMEETNQTLTNLRNQVTNTELELKATQEHVDTLTTEKARAGERIQRLEQQSQEYLARCKALTTHNNTLEQGQSSQGTGNIANPQGQQAEDEHAIQDFEANKMGWIHRAAKVIATHAHQWLREHVSQLEDPPQEFFDYCIDNALSTLEMEQSEHDWDSVDLEDIAMEALSPLIAPEEEHAPISPARAAQEDPRPPSLTIPDIHEQVEHVDIPENFDDPEDTPQPSPHLQPPAQAAQGPVNPMVFPRPKTFKSHKDALKKIEEEFGLEVQASDDEEAEEELDTAIEEVKRYFSAHPDLIALYSNPEADHVQCPDCNRILGKTVYDVFQHAVTSRSKHNLIHRGVGATIAAIYGNQAPPRRRTQLPREETRPDRRPAHKRTRG